MLSEIDDDDGGHQIWAKLQKRQQWDDLNRSKSQNIASTSTHDTKTIYIHNAANQIKLNTQKKLKTRKQDVT